MAFATVEFDNSGSIFTILKPLSNYFKVNGIILILVNTSSDTPRTVFVDFDRNTAKSISTDDFIRNHIEFSVHESSNIVVEVDFSKYLEDIEVYDRVRLSTDSGDLTGHAIIFYDLVEVDFNMLAALNV